MIAASEDDCPVAADDAAPFSGLTEFRGSHFQVLKIPGDAPDLVAEF